MAIAYPIPPFAPGRFVELPDRGTTFIRELLGPDGAPTLVLLHGWSATAGLNWHSAMPALAAHFNVVAMDLRGHGRGIRDGSAFSYEACADDVAALIAVLGRGPAIVAGFSMGGPIAEVVWRRHPEAVAGLVLASVAGRDPNNVIERAAFAVLRAVFRFMPAAVFSPWWVAHGWQGSRWLRPLDEVGHSDARRVIEAGQVAGGFDTRSWQSGIDVPTSVVVSTRDILVPVDHQRAVADAIRGATIVSLVGGHLAFLVRPERFTASVVAACTDVADRLRTSPRPARPTLPAAEVAGIA